MNHRIQVSRGLAGAGWAAAERLDGAATGDALTPDLGVDGSGVAVAVWELQDGSQFDIHASRFR